MERIKNFFVGVAKFAYSFFVQPIVELKNLFKMDNTRKAITIIEAASRVTIMASWFFAVPAFLVALAWTWIIGTVVWLAVSIAFTLGMVASLGGFANKVVADIDAADAAAASKSDEPTIIVAQH